MKHSRKIYLTKLFPLLAGLFFVTAIQAQNVSGFVADEQNEPLIGVSVAVKGSNTGTTTDLEGKYSVPVSGTGSVLVFSYIGYKTQEIAVADKREINVILIEDNRTLDEVVVVGYGVQKKVNLTGAVSAVGSEAFENRPVANIGQAIAGVVPNLNVTIGTGSPDAVPTFNIRGGTSMSLSNGAYVVTNAEPLILIDGVETTGALLNQLNPENIASMSVVKDASAAAIYGTKAAFGVILITTKNGKFNQKGKISYSFDMAWDTPSALPNVMNTYQIQRAAMEKKEWISGNYTPDNWSSVTDKEVLDAAAKYLADPRPENAYIRYPGGTRTWVASMNPFEDVVRDWTPVQKHNLNISGGGDKVSYYISLGYMGQEGMYKVNTDQYNRYNAMFTTTAQVTDWFKATARLSYNRTTYKAPFVPSSMLAGTDLSREIWAFMATNDNARLSIPVRLAADDPDYPNMPTQNIVAWLANGANSTTTASSSMMTLSPEFTLVKNVLRLKADMTYYPQSSNYERYAPQYTYIDYGGAQVTQHAASNMGQLNKGNTDNYTINTYLDFNKTFAKVHDVSAVVGYNQEKTSYSYIAVDMEKLFSPNILNPVVSEDITLQRPSTNAWTRTGRAVFGRVNYIFADRYLFEFNGRYDGSSRFTPDERFLFFPSFSLGWRVSEESFMAQTKSWLNNLKLRGSYGTLGSQPSSNYPYQAQMTSSVAGTLIDGQFVSTVGSPNLVSPTLTWEKATTIDLGIDLMILNRLDASFDWYQRTTTDILTDGSVAYPAVLGATAPTENSGELQARGWELAVKWNDRLLNNQIRYDVGLVLSDARTKVLHYAANPEKFISKLYDGQYVGEIWGYETGGIVQESDGEWYMDGTARKWRLTNTGIIPFNGTETLYPGYVWRKDINGDDKLNDGNQKVGDSGDMKIIGDNTPRYRFGLTTNWYYKGIDFNLFLQGVGKRDVWISSASYWGGSGVGNLWMYENAWRPDRTDAKYPMYSVVPTTQSAYLFNGAYLRCKQMSLGYTLPHSLTKKAGAEKARIYLSGYNLFEITSIPDVFDPDQISTAYPAKRTVAFGIQLGF
ncbi:MAG: TonB-dependent receptor [Dysgonamonadaceae bacterium]|jgi:TonB-linked SusC/RagA family outer membrane protein|nr:TonB-dependent receptor [Dysgonamonadaceae bacterium]